MDIIKLSTPTAITGVIKEWCQTFAPDCPLIHVDVTPQGMPTFCHKNVKDYIFKNGGITTYGWIIWTLENQWIEAEPHCIVRIGSTYIDPTPQVDGENTILFLIDNQARHEQDKKRSKKLVENETTARLLELSVKQQRHVDAYNKRLRKLADKER